MAGCYNNNRNTPSPYDIKHRLKWYILGKYSEDVFSENKSTVDVPGDITLTNPSLEKGGKLNQNDFEGEIDCSTGAMLRNIVAEKSKHTASEAVENVFEDDTVPEQLVTGEALQYFAGYVAHRFISKYPNLNLGVKTHELDKLDDNSWISKVSRGFLFHPSDLFMKIAERIEELFVHLHGDFFDKGPAIVSKIVNVFKREYRDFPEEVLRCLLVRTRTYIFEN